MKKTLSKKNFCKIGLSLLSLLLITISGDIFAASKKTFKMAVVLDMSDPMSIYLQYWADAIDELSKGELKATIFHSAKLGGERETIEQIQSQALDGASLSGGVLTNFVPEWKFYTLPFIFTSQEECVAFEGSREAVELRKYTEKAGLKWLGYEPLLFRSVMSKMPLKTPEDAKGVKIRSLESPMMVQGYNLMGFNAIPISYSEVYTAIQTGVVQAYDQGVMTLSLTKMWELMKNLTLTNAYYDGCFLMMSLKTYNSLDENQKKIVNTAAEIATQKIIVKIQSLYDYAVKDLTDHGVNIIQPDLKAFTAKTRPLYDQFIKEFPALEPMIKRAHISR